jgi:hypothetical protein
MSSEGQARNRIFEEERQHNLLRNPIAKNMLGTSLAIYKRK